MKHQFKLSILALCVAVAPMTVSAEEVEKDKDGELQFEVITVTAQKRDSAVQDVPLSVVALTEDALQIASVGSLTDLGTLIAGVEITSINPESNAVTSRGITQAGELSGGIEATAVMGLYVDETPVTAFGANFPSIAFWDVNRVEVLRGPQGTLFGEGSMAGTLRVISNKPDLEETSAKIAVGYSNQKDGDIGYNARAMVNIPVVEDKFAIRASVGFEELGGWIDVVDMGTEDSNDTSRTDAKIAARIQASDELTIDASVIYQKLELDDSFFQTHPGLNDPQSQLSGVEEITQLSYLNTEFTIYNLTFKYDFGPATLVSATSFFDSERDLIDDLNPNLTIFFNPFGLPLGLSEGTGAGEFESTSESYTQELRLVSNGDQAVDWTIGAFYKQLDRTSRGGYNFHFDAFMPELDFLGFPFGAVIDDHGISFVESSVESYALFAEVEFELSETVFLTLGGRYYSDDRELTTTVEQASPFIFGTTLGVQGPVPGDDSSFSPNVIINWQVDEQVLVFAKASRGFRSGGVNIGHFELEAIPADYNSELLTAYEAGIKTAGLVKNVQANFYLYFNDWQDLQLDFTTDDGFYGFKANGGGAEAFGAELEILTKVSEELTVSFNTAYTDSTLTEEVVNALGGILAADGNFIPGIPKVKINVGIDYQTPVSDTLVGRIHLDYTYRDSSFTDIANNPVEENDAYDMVNLRVGVANEDWTVSLVARNLTDERASTIRTNRINGSPLISANYFRPRTIGVEFTADF